MLSNSSCSSEFVVYIIKCIVCNTFYIGQTELLSRRLNTHIRNCILNRYTLSSRCSGVVKHFNTTNQCSMKSFTFSVFRSNIYDRFERLNIETQLIHLFLDLHMNLLNDWIPDRYYWYRNVKLFQVND